MKKMKLTIALVAIAPATLWAQDRDPPRPDDDICAESSRRYDRQGRYCEVREATLEARDVLRVDGRTNGGITVVGWDRSDILVRAKVAARSRDGDQEARALANEVDVRFDSRVIEADGPRTRNRDSWHVSYEIFLPHDSNLDLETHNGGIGIYDVTGTIDFDVVNGGAYLSQLGGDVRGETTNGGLHIVLAGDSWDGRGMDVSTTNGGVSMWVPDGYNAELETGAVNGGLEVDFPVTVQGRFGRRRLRTELGQGGPLVRAITTNGGVRIRRL